MTWRERLLLHALTNGMELSWLGAWATFATIGTMGRTFPLVEATVAFVGAVGPVIPALSMVSATLLTLYCSLTAPEAGRSTLHLPVSVLVSLATSVSAT